MSEKESFDKRYESGITPWELERPDSNLIEVIKNKKIHPCKALDIGCGTGSNAVWLAQNGFDIHGTDFSELAIEKAEKKAGKENLNIPFIVKDFLTKDLIGSDFEFIFDRGCFHSIEQAEDRRVFARNVSCHLKEEGLWFSLIGNADAGPRKEGPPVRSALDIVLAVEPYFEILSLVSDRFDSKREEPARCWKCLMKKR